MASCLSHQPHKKNIVAVPFPLHGHITPMLHLSRRLAASGFTITFINTERNHPIVARFLSRYPSTINIHLVSLPDNLPPDFQLTSLDTASQFLQSVQHLRWAFQDVMELQLTSTTPLCILSDVHVGWTQDIATKFQLPRIALWTSNASECQVYFQAPRLISQGYLPFKGTSQNITVPIPGLPPLQPREFPSLLQMEDAAHICFSYYVNQTKRIAEADVLLINSFLELENTVFNALRTELIKVYPVGPLFMLEQRDASTPSDLSPDEDGCIKWLDNQAANSVLYVSFGSTVPLTCAQIVSLALGLERSRQPFLWALRSSEHLPDGFDERTRDRGVLVSWAPQVRILGHPSVGGFLTHCGWNSAMESLSMGVPMICSPLAADQILTCKLIVDEWKVGLKFSGGEGGLGAEDELANLTRELLLEERGRDLRLRTEKLRDAARRARDEDGETWTTLKMLLEKLESWQQQP